MWRLLAGREDIDEVHLIVRAEARQQRRAREWYERMGFRAAWRWARREYNAEEDGGTERNEKYLVATREEVMGALEGEMVDGGLVVTRADGCRAKGGDWHEEEAVRMLRQHFGRQESRRVGADPEAACLNAGEHKPEWVGMRAHIKAEYVKLGWTGRGELMEWHPQWLEKTLSEESVVQAWLLGRLRLGIRMRVTRAGGARRRETGGEGADERAEAEDAEEDEGDGRGPALWAGRWATAETARAAAVGGQVGGEAHRGRRTVASSGNRGVERRRRQKGGSG